MITKVRVRGYRLYRDFSFYPNERLNLLVGGNESGKSTLIEAMTLALTGRINGRWATEELNPHWFNTSAVADLVASLRDGKAGDWPEIHIELFLEDRDDLQYLAGAVNSELPVRSCPGLSLRVQPDPAYGSELEEWSQAPTDLMPIEYFSVDWRSFADEVLTRRPRQLVTAVIDSRTVRASGAVDYHLRQILRDQLTPEERAGVSLAYRDVKAGMSENALKDVNDRMAIEHEALHDRPITLAMDQTARTSWEGAVTPHVAEVPFSMAGEGQQAAIKISLAMSRHSERASFVMIEEPENHLSYPSLVALLSRVEALAGDHQQLFIATHNSFVLNRLGVDALHLLGQGTSMRLPDLAPDTVAYFKKLPGYDTLRMVIADKIVLVEGPSDEIVFERVFADLFDGKRPLEHGIDVLSLRGLSFKRCLALCSALDKTVAVIRDNDGVEPAEHRVPLEPWLLKGRRELFIGSPGAGETLEPQFVHANGEAETRQILGVTEAADLSTWMKREKTEGALRIAQYEGAVVPPDYLAEAARFIHG